MKCNVCNKSIKEDADGDNKYCQGHEYGERQAILKRLQGSGRFIIAMAQTTKVEPK